MKRKLLALLLAAAMLLSLAACGSTETSSDAASAVPDENADSAGTDGETASGDEGTYTYRSTMSSISTWSPTDAKDANEYMIREYTCVGLYSFIMNDAKDNYEIVPEMATSMPEDVTAEYAGDDTYGVPSDATEGYAYKVTLREDATWEDGTPINADTYVYTLQQYLNPEMKNYIAATWYEGTTPIANAESYYKGESTEKVYGDAYEVVEPGTALADVDTTLYLNLSETVYLFTDYYAREGYGDGYIYSINDMFGYGEDYWSGCMIDESTYIWDKYEFDTDYEVTDEIVAELDYMCSLWGYDSGYWMYLCKYEVEGGTVYGDAYEIVEPGTALADVDTDLYLNLNETVYLFTDYYASQGYGDGYVYSIAQMESFGEDYWPSLTLEDGTYIWDKYAYDTDILVTDEVVEDLDYICWLWGYDSGYWMYLCKYIKSGGDTATGEATTWDQVGVVKNDDYSFTLIFAQKVSEFNFLSTAEGLYLVNEELYEANKQETGGVIKSSYGTDVDNYLSYGPYKIAAYQADKEISLTKNENWYGYSDGEHEGQYQTTDIVLSMIDEHSTEFSMFLQGDLDVVGLSSEEMETYANSEFCYYEPTGYVYFYVLNSDFDQLKAEEQEGENRTILSYLDFRKAISWAIDRSEYITTLNPSSEAAYGLLNDLYYYDFDTGALYRESDAAKQALCNLYETDSVDDITGYDVEKAAELFQAAYDDCKADGNISDTDIVTIDFHMWGADATYVKMADFFENSILEACKGTDLEGRVTVNLVEDQECYNSMRNGLADVIYGSWGMTVNPYSDMQIYTLSDYQYDQSFDASQAELTISLDGTDVTMSLTDWWYALNQGDYSSVDSEIRVQILAAMEQRVLENYTSIPLYYTESATLYSQRIVLGSEDWVNAIVGYGGIRFMTYTMNDAEWEAYCAENNNQLDYQ